MAHDKQRRKIIAESARLMSREGEGDSYRARLRAAKSIVGRWVRSDELPSGAEVRDELERAAWLYEGGASVDTEDRFQVYRLLLLPLEQVEQRRTTHPEGDALYHSLQVFALACGERAWDEEFLLAALLHDVGKGIDPLDHVAAGLDALEGYITPRTAWLIENHRDAQRLHDGSIGQRAKRRLQEHEDYDALVALSRCDRDGRVPGRQVPTVDEALAMIRDLAESCD